MQLPYAQEMKKSKILMKYFLCFNMKRMLKVIIKIQQHQMRPRTPQKKNSFELDRKVDMNNNSYLFSVQNNSSIIHSGQSINNEEIHSKNSQLNINHKNNLIHHTNKISLAKKYVQQSMVRNRQLKQKQYRQVVISEQFVRSHKLFKMLKQQMAVADARHVRQTNTLAHDIEKQENQIKQIKDGNHKLKFQLWELKTKFMELKTTLQEEQQENKRLVEEYEYVTGQKQGNEGQEGQQEQGQGENGENEQEKDFQQIYEQQENKKNESEKMLNEILQQMKNTFEDNEQDVKIENLGNLYPMTLKKKVKVGNENESKAEEEREFGIEYLAESYSRQASDNEKEEDREIGEIGSGVKYKKKENKF